MSFAVRDGSWITVIERTELKCTECGVFMLATRRLNEHEVRKAIDQHLVNQHNGEALA